MWTDPTASDRITQQIISDKKPRVRSNLAENMPTTKKEINNQLLELLERDREKTEQERTPWFTQLKKQFY